MSNSLCILNLVFYFPCFILTVFWCNPLQCHDFARCCYFPIHTVQIKMGNSKQWQQIYTIKSPHTSGDWLLTCFWEADKCLNLTSNQSLKQVLDPLWVFLNEQSILKAEVLQVGWICWNTVPCCRVCSCQENTSKALSWGSVLFSFTW